MNNVDVADVYNVPVFEGILVEGMVDQGHDRNLSEQATSEFLKYVSLAKDFPGVALGMAGLADEVWHLALLNTQKYAKFCHMIFGEFLHHVPGKNDGSGMESYEQTLHLLEGKFGEVNTGIWPILPTEVGSCQNGCDSCGSIRMSCHGQEEVPKPSCGNK